MRALIPLAVACLWATSWSAALAAQSAASGYNDAAIRWHGLDEGLAEAKASGRRVLLVVTDPVDPVCLAYRAMFFDAAVVAALGGFVPVLVDQRNEGGQAARYAPGGAYVPRTMVLSPDGAVLAQFNSGWADYPYFYAPDIPAALVSVLNAALR